MWKGKRITKNKGSRKVGFTLVEIMVVVAIIGVLCAMILPNFINARLTSQMNACIENLRQIDAAKQQWALEQHGTTTSTPSALELQPYLGHGSAGELPICPADSQRRPSFNSSYKIENVGTKPICKQVSTTHILP